MFKIVEWAERYEVSIKGREPKAGEELRAGPLAYVRLKVFGHKQGAGYRRMKSLAGDRTMEVFGVFCKLLEISGNQPRERRGGLFNEKDAPATIEDLAFILDIPTNQAENSVSVLLQANWLADSDSPSHTPPNTTQHNITQLKDTEISGKIRKTPTFPQNKQSISPTFEEVKNECFKQGLSDAEAELLHAHYEEVGWVTGLQNPVLNLSACVTKWRLRKPEFEAKKPQNKTEIEQKRKEEIIKNAFGGQ